MLVKLQATVELAGHYSRGNMLLESRVFVEKKKDFKTNVVVVDGVDEDAFKAAVLEAFSYKF